MNRGPIARIISYNPDSTASCAAAARISTTPGDALALYQESCTSQKNDNLIRKVIQSGHKSVLEHACVTIACCNVSVVVEQFFIEFRLASFTVKSRRYVSFADQGYYIPQGLSPACQEAYTRHMDSLFADYGALLELGIPKEDARFLLPYCFHSNFYCTVNVRELIHILGEIRRGRGRDIPELHALAKQLEGQLEGLFPWAAAELVPQESAVLSGRLGPIGAPQPVQASSELLAYSEGGFQTAMALYASQRQGDRLSRELEHITASFLIRDLSLSGITHVARHRMQALVIPSLLEVKAGHYVLPETVKGCPQALERYAGAFQRSGECIAALRSMGFQEERYLCLSGNTIDMMTTMNAREMLHFFKLRCCNRAQWEIQAVAREMLSQLRERAPQVFDQMGPSCFVDGKCPEGRLTCGSMAQVLRDFGGQKKWIE